MVVPARTPYRAVSIGVLYCTPISVLALAEYLLIGVPLLRAVALQALITAGTALLVGATLAIFIWRCTHGG